MTDGTRSGFSKQEGTRSGFAKQFSKSDSDLLRWQQALTDNSRYNKLLSEVRHRWHPDFLADRADLTQNHNALRRKRSAVAADKDKDEKKSTLVQQVREMKARIDPGLRKTKKTRRMDSYNASAPGSPAASPRTMGNQNDVQRRLSAVSAHSFDPDNASTGSLAAQPAGAVRAPRGVRPIPVEMPRSLAVLLYRNADRMHAGETLLVRRWPVAKLEDLLVACCQACRPIIAPVEALLDMELQPVRSVEQVAHGGVYLVKGGEALSPPPLFFSHQNHSGVSLKVLNQARRSAEAEQDMLDRMSPAPSPSTSTVLPQLRPFAGAPPWPSTAPLSKPCRGTKWQVNQTLGATLLWSGLGQLHRHHEFASWRRALGSGCYDEQDAMAATAPS